MRILHGASERELAGKVELPPNCPPEPRWADLLPGRQSVTLRADCGRVWRSIVPDLDRHGVLARVDELLVIDACICAARIRQCERRIAREGLTKETDRGAAKNPLTTVVAQYRTQFRVYVSELGLSPSARSRLPWDIDDAGDPLEAIFTRAGS